LEADGRCEDVGVGATVLLAAVVDRLRKHVFDLGLVDAVAALEERVVVVQALEYALLPVLRVADVALVDALDDRTDIHAAVHRRSVVQPQHGGPVAWRDVERPKQDGRKVHAEHAPNAQYEIVPHARTKYPHLAKRW